MYSVDISLEPIIAKYPYSQYYINKILLLEGITDKHILSADVYDVKNSCILIEYIYISYNISVMYEYKRPEKSSRLFHFS